jgi:hypothetical protein
MSGSADPYYHPYYGGYYAPRYVDRSVTARQAGRLIAFHVFVRLIPSAEHIWVTTVDSTIVDSSSRNSAGDTQR